MQYTKGVSAVNERLWYKQPAANWNEALPIGSGRLGAMVFGRPENEILQLNEDTLWSGFSHPDTPAVDGRYLKKIRELLAAERYVEADEMTKVFQGPFTQSYQPLGTLHLHFQLPGSPLGYRRQLDLAEAVTSVLFTAGGTEFRREYLASYADQLLVIHCEADKPASHTVRITFMSSLQADSAAQAAEIWLHGRAPSHVDPNYVHNPIPIIYSDAPEEHGLSFSAGVRVWPQGGHVRTEGSVVVVEEADSITIIAAAATNFAGPFVRPCDSQIEPRALCERHLDAFSSYASVKARHIQDHHALFGRVSLELGSDHDRCCENESQPTDVRLRSVQQGKDDPGLAALCFQFGRYLLTARYAACQSPRHMESRYATPLELKLDAEYQHRDELLGR